MKLLSHCAGLAVALIAAIALATPAHADPLKCKQEIAKDLSKYVQAKAKALQKCREAIAKGKIAPQDCHLDATASAKIAKADSKARAKINKTCGGDDQSCASTGDNDSLASIGWPSMCPDFENVGCNNSIGNCNDIADCILCIGEAAVDQSMSLSYDALAPGQFGTGSDINKCQVAIGKNAMKFLNAKNKALQKCEDAVLKGSISGPCPDAAGAQVAIAKAETKKVAKICKACGGDDKLCDNTVTLPDGGTIAGSGGSDDITPAQIGFPANCSDVTVPGGPSCLQTISTLADIVECVDCVNEYKDDCLDALSVPALKAYPIACNPPVGPTPCPTATPGITCPTQVVTEAIGNSVDLDTGWTGQSHDGHAPSMGRLTLTVSACTNPTASTCGTCNVSGPQPNAGGSAFNNRRCVLDTQIQCTTNADCGVNGPCSYFFGGPLPLSAGGVSVCVTNQITAPVSGTVDVEAGSTVSTIQLLSRVHVGPTTDQPCPQCISGTCNSGPHAGGACVINGHSNLFGDVSFDCPPSPGANVGNLPITLPYDTGTQTRSLSSSNPACRAPGFGTSKCFCDTCNNAAATSCTSNADCVAAGATICGGRRCQGGGNNGTPCTVNSECPGGGCGVPGAQTKPNDCDDSTCYPTSTCVGGSNDFLNCGAPSDCPGGSCVLANEGTCANGPFEQFCIIQTFRGCLSNADCTLPGDSCTLGKFRDCFLDNGVVGTHCFGGTNAGEACGGLGDCPDQVTPGVYCGGGSVTVTGAPYPPCGNVGTGSIGSLFCINPTSSGSVNSVSGLPGLGRVILPYISTFN